MLAWWLACATPVIGTDSGTPAGADGGSGDAGGSDAGSTPTDPDGGSSDGGAQDGGTTPTDGGTTTWPACVPMSDLSNPHLWEGDRLAFTVACSGELATADADLWAVSLPEGADFQPSTGILTWQTGGADGGRKELVFGAWPAGASHGVPEQLTVTVWVADNPDVAGAVAVDPLTYTEEWGLPVLHVETGGSITESYRPAAVHWHGTAFDGEIKIRGASSVYYPKPSYTLDFDDVEPWFDAFGATREHLVLLTTFDDNSYVRQKLIYDQWAAIADHWDVDRLTPRSFFVVVYLDGAYNGLYVGLDFIDDEFVRQQGFDDSGELFKAVDHDANFYLTGSGGGAKSTLHDGYTKKQGEPLSDFSQLDELVAFTGATGLAEVVAQADEWVRLDEFMDWFLLVHYALAEDSAGKNSYLYAEPTLGTFLYVPWDFNHAWGQNWYTVRLSSSSLNDHRYSNRVFAAIQSEADAELWDRFRELRGAGPYDPAWIAGQLDGYYAEIDPSAARDWAEWEESYRSYGSWSGTRSAYRDWTDFEGEKDYLYTWVEERGELFEFLVP